MKIVFFLTFSLILSLYAQNEKNTDDLMKNLAIGEFSQKKEIVLSWIDEALEEAENHYQKKDYDKAMEKINSVLAKEPTHGLACRLRDKVKRDQFIHQHGSKFLIVLALMIAVPMLIKFLEQLYAVLVKKK